MQILDSAPRDFEYEGEMTADLALDHELLLRHYPFARLTGAANILVMPSLSASNISAKLLRKIGADSVISARSSWALAQARQHPADGRGRERYRHRRADGRLAVALCWLRLA